MRGSAEEMFEKYADMVYRIAANYCSNRWNAEDIVQDVFVRYMKRQPDFESEEHEKAWFVRVSVNCSKSLLSGFWGKRVVPVGEYHDSDIPAACFADEENGEVFAAVLKLPPRYRIVLYLHYYEGYSVNEIAKLLGTTPNNISARLSRARKMLKRYL